VKWTGHKATKDVEAILGLLRARNVEDARKSLNDFGVGAQNWVVADSHGDIFYSSHAAIPKRDRAAFDWKPETFTGLIPCMVLPGDGSTSPPALTKFIDWMRLSPLAGEVISKAGGVPAFNKKS
jgi:penicillin amidase